MHQFENALQPYCHKGLKFFWFFFVIQVCPTFFHIAPPLKLKCTNGKCIKHWFNNVCKIYPSPFVHGFVPKIPPCVKKNTTRVWKCTKKICTENAPKNQQYDNSNVSNYTGLSQWCIICEILHGFVRSLYTGLSQNRSFFVYKLIFWKK